MHNEYAPLYALPGATAFQIRMANSSPLARHLKGWSTAALAEHPCTLPEDSFLAALEQRLGPDLLARLAKGLDEGLVVQHAHRFQAKGSDAGPFRWFSRRSWQSYGLHPNWEAFVHVDYFLRISRARGLEGRRLSFEHHGLDLVIWQDARVWWYIEVKETAAQARSLADRVIEQGHVGFGHTVASRRDAVRKARHLLAFKPDVFSAVGLNYQSHYRVTLKGSTKFTLEPATAPFEF